MIDGTMLDDTAFVQQESRPAKGFHRSHIMTDEDDCPALLGGHVLHLTQTLILEIGIAHGEYLIHDEDLTF